MSNYSAAKLWWKQNIKYCAASRKHRKTIQCIQWCSWVVNNELPNTDCRKIKEFRIKFQRFCSWQFLRSSTRNRFLLSIRTLKTQENRWKKNKLNNNLLSGSTNPTGYLYSPLTRAGSAGSNSKITNTLNQTGFFHTHASAVKIQNIFTSRTLFRSGEKINWVF